MKNRFVKLTLFLCVIMLIGTSSSVFAASGSCGAAKNSASKCSVQKYGSSDCGLARSTGNYMSLFGKSNDDCMNALIKCFGLKVKQPANNSNNSCGTNNSANNTVNNANNNCVGSNCNTGSNAGNKQDCTGPNCGSTGGNANSGSQNQGSNANAGSNTNTNTNVNVSSYAKQVADLVNEERSAAGLSSLTMNANLCKVAQAKAEDMRDKNYFSHTSPTYGSPFDMMKQFGITYSAAGENIAKGQRSPESVMTAWMNSQGHRANILSSAYSQIGVGYCTDASGNTYWVQMFIK